MNCLAIAVVAAKLLTAYGEKPLDVAVAHIGEQRFHMVRFLNSDTRSWTMAKVSEQGCVVELVVGSKWQPAPEQLVRPGDPS